MMARKAALLVFVVSLMVALGTCNQALMVAPPGSTITLIANPKFIAAHGDVSVISGLVLREEGTALRLSMSGGAAWPHFSGHPLDVAVLGSVRGAVMAALPAGSGFLDVGGALSLVPVPYRSLIGPDAGQPNTRVAGEPPRAVALRRLDQIDSEVRHARELRQVGLGGADVEPPVHLTRVRGDDDDGLEVAPRGCDRRFADAGGADQNRRQGSRVRRIHRLKPVLGNALSLRTVIRRAHP